MSGNNSNSQSEQRQSKFRYFENFPLMLLFFIALGGFLRFWGIEDRSLWLDEATSLFVANKPVFEILTGKGFDSHTPPFYYLLLNPWLQLFSDKLFGLRALSGALDVINIFLIFHVISKHFSDRIALYTSALFSVSAYAIYYAQEGRMYSLLLFLVLLTHYLAIRFIENRPQLKSCVPIFILCVFGMYTHYYYALYLFSLSVGMLLFLPLKSQHFKYWLTIMFLVGLAFVPWLQVIFELVSGEGQHFRKFVFSVLPYTFFRFIAGYGVMPLNLGSKDDLMNTVVANIGVLSLYGIFFGITLIAPLRAVLTSENRLNRIFNCVLFLPPLLALVISLKTPMLSERYLIVIYPFFLTLLAVALSTLSWKTVFSWRRSVFELSSMVLFLVGLYQHIYNSEFDNTPWKSASDFIKASRYDVKDVITKPHYADDLINYYLNPTYKIDKTQLSKRFLESPTETYKELPKSFWLVERGNEQSLERYLKDRSYRVIAEQDYVLGNGLRLFLMRR